ncbi:hypothetical protein N7449_006051 [Penicillium cf. viridicatum]|uniref:Uncharacterized protein n=1 Tax=Penicillium cf. viridicatum TaxID=2972119 RepID=A0A9W9MH75_9EURO|nr:hypothetical protein N7449_006051 [Penicillium cf. viridicatum]
MIEYESTWFKFRNSKLLELMPTKPHSTDPPVEEDMVENRDEDERILNELRELQISKGDNRT